MRCVWVRELGKRGEVGSCIALTDFKNNRT